MTTENKTEHKIEADKTSGRVLVRSFIVLLAVSIFVFTLLAAHLSARSRVAVYEVSEIYMSGMNEQMTKHFEALINLRFTQVNGIITVVSSDTADRQRMYEDLAFRAQVRDFEYLALCSTTGEMQTLLGSPIQVREDEINTLTKESFRMASGWDEEGNELVLIGVDAAYPMDNGEKSAALVAAIDMNYITDFLGMDDNNQMQYFHIMRPDGSFVAKHAGENAECFLEKVKLVPGDPTASAVLPGLDDAIQKREKFAIEAEIDGKGYQVYGLALPYSNWYLTSVMPYNVLEGTVERLSNYRAALTLGASLVVLIGMVLVFFKYYSVNKEQMRELVEAQQAAMDASKAKSEFLANMSHDIRTPMNAIVGMTAIATAHVDDREHLMSCLKKIALSSRHLLSLINDILDMSKIESGKMTLTSEQISLREVVERISSIMQPQVHTKQQTFDIHISEIQTEQVWCDGVRLNQVLLNLLSNAMKYTPEGGAISLAMTQEDSPKGDNYVRVRMKIKDNGIGMSEEFLQRIYESYNRADKDRVHKIEGTGLGMAITKHIVDAMEGTIEIQSELDKGTDIDLTFDMEKACDETGELNMVLPPWNMLVVDDDETLCKTASSTLDSFGIHAEWCMSGEEAIKMVVDHHKRREDYQVILLDWKLPGMSGIQAAKEIRRELGNDVPIVLISAYDWSDFEAEAREAGVNGFIAKPLFKSTLYHALRQYMGVAAEDEQATSEKKVDLSGHRVLLAEDNDLNWEIANELLSELGLELEWAEDGQICLDKFKDSPVGYYDAILMDLRMPNMTGHEAAVAIRALDRPDAETVPIIAMSADAFSEDVQRSLANGMNAHIAKPIDMTEVSNILKRFLN